MHITCQMTQIDERHFFLYKQPIISASCCDKFMINQWILLVDYGFQFKNFITKTQKYQNVCAWKGVERRGGKHFYRKYGETCIVPHKKSQTITSSVISIITFIIFTSIIIITIFVISYCLCVKLVSHIFFLNYSVSHWLFSPSLFLFPHQLIIFVWRCYTSLRLPMCLV